MDGTSIFVPICVLAFWTLIVLSLVGFRRVSAAARREVSPGDFKLGESAAVPAHVSIPNRNYMNLLEVPVLFYLVCIVLYVTGSADALAVNLAWAYVGARIVHSLIHLTYNHVLHRLAAFATSNLILLALWIRLAITL